MASLIMKQITINEIIHNNILTVVNEKMWEHNTISRYTALRKFWDEVEDQIEIKVGDRIMVGRYIKYLQYE